MEQTMISRLAAPARRVRVRNRDPLGLLVVLVLAGLGYVLFPDNLALLTRLIATAFLVLSLDLVTGYCGVATLGQAALFGAGAYAAGIASARYGIEDPLAMTGIGLVGGALAGLVCGTVILRAHGLRNSFSPSPWSTCSTNLPTRPPPGPAAATGFPA